MYTPPVVGLRQLLAQEIPHLHLMLVIEHGGDSTPLKRIESAYTSISVEVLPTLSPAVLAPSLGGPARLAHPRQSASGALHEPLDVLRLEG
jgi:hypothetical protein